MCNYGCKFSDNSQAQHCASYLENGVYCTLLREIRQKSFPCSLPWEEITLGELRERCEFSEEPAKRKELKVITRSGCRGFLGKYGNGKLFIKVPSSRIIHVEEDTHFAMEEDGKLKIYKVVG